MPKTYKNEDKLKLPLNEILIQRGYQVKKEKSSQNFITLSHENGDNLVISRQSNGHYLYFNTSNENDKGNIYSFCKNRGIDIKELLSSNNQNKPLEHSLKINTNEIINKNKEYNESFEKLPLIDNQKNYLNERFISESTLKNFTNIKTDTYENIIIPKYQVFEKNLKTIKQCGYISYLKNPIYKDKQNNEYKKPLKTICYGSKGLEILASHYEKQKTLSAYKNIVITESSLDSLSFYQMYQKENKFDENTLLCSTNGTPSKEQIRLIKHLDEQCKDARFYLAFDNDAQGQKYSQELEKLIKNNELIIQKPILKDNNDDLVVSKLLNVEKPNLQNIEKQMNYLVKNIKEYTLKESTYINSTEKNKAYEKARMSNNMLIYLKPKLEKYTDYSKIEINLRNFQRSIQQENTNQRVRN